MPNPVAAVAADTPPWRKLLAESLKGLPLVGPPLAVMVLDARVGASVTQLLLLLAGALLIYPLALVLLVCWLLQSSWFPDSWRQFYAQEVRQAFRVDAAALEMTNRDHQRLDYFQLIEMRKPASPPQGFTLRVKPYQQLFIRPQQVSVVSLDPIKCPLPRSLSGKELFVLTAADLELRRLTEGRTDQKASIDLALWDKLAARDDDELVIQLDLSDKLKSEELAALQCSSVVTNVRLAVEVFKGFVEGAPAGGLKR